MSLQWRVRHELARRRFLALIPFPLLVAALLAFALGWGVSRREASDVLAAMTSPFKAANDDSMNRQLEESRSELDSERQEVEYMNRQVQQANAALVAANDKLQTVQGELAATDQSLAAANASREEARRQLTEVCKQFYQAGQSMPTPCSAQKPQ